MDKLTTYLFNHDTSFIARSKNVLAGFAFMALWTVLMIVGLNWLYDVGKPDLQFKFIFNPPSLAFQFMTACILAPLWEELVFRKVPIDLAGKLFQMKESLMLIVLFSSVIFGLVHGSPVKILIQGVMGFVMALVYIKNGFHFWSSVILHALWNAMVMFGFSKI